MDRYPKPQIIIDPFAAANPERADIVAGIQTFDSAVHANPPGFVQALENLGEHATSDTADLAIGNVPGRMMSAAEELIMKLFRDRYERYSEYDPATATSIEADEDYRQLIQEAVSKKSYSVSVPGTMRTEQRANAEAPDARDAARRHRLALYLKRVMDYTAASTDGVAEIDISQAVA